jgi:DnaJ-class molecular chaperone
MSEVGNASGRGGNIARVTGRLVRLVRAAGDRLFQAEDIRASQNGWLITARRGGLARTYRDPRFDRFRNCPACCGTGTGSAEKPCNRCDGTGRIAVSQTPLADRRQG